MKTSEAARIMAAAGLKVTDEDARMWAVILDDTRPDDALQAVVRHRRISAYPVTPADVYAGARAIRRDRLEAAGDEPVPPIDPEDTLAYRSWLRLYRGNVADGMTVPAAVEATNHALGIAAITSDTTRRVPELPSMQRP